MNEEKVKPKKACPSVYRRAAEILVEGGTQFSCTAITSWANIAPNQWKHRELYTQVFQLDDDKDLLEQYLNAFPGWHLPNSPEEQALRDFRVLALLFMAEWCKGKNLPE